MGKDVKRLNFSKVGKERLMVVCLEVANMLGIDVEELVELLEDSDDFKGIKRYILETDPTFDKNEDGGEVETDTTLFHQVQGKRDYQEDRILFHDQENLNGNRICILGIFDGHGGSQVSDYLLDTYTTYFSSFIATGKFMSEGNIVHVYNTIDKDILSLEGDFSLQGSTATVVFWSDLNPLTFQIVQLGDSFCYFKSGRGKTLYESPNHSPDDPDEIRRLEGLGGEQEGLIESDYDKDEESEDEVGDDEGEDEEDEGEDEDEDGYQDEDEGEVESEDSSSQDEASSFGWNKLTITESGRVTHADTSGSFSVSRSFGDFDFKKSEPQDNQVISSKPDVKIVKLKGKLSRRRLERITIYLGSDGVTESLTKAQIFQHTTSQKLVEKALHEKSTDNISAIVVDMSYFM